MERRVIAVPKARPVRYEHARPGDLAHVDVKKLGRIPNGGGHRTGSYRREPEQQKAGPRLRLPPPRDRGPIPDSPTPRS